MTDEQFTREQRFQAAMSVARTMRALGVIGAAEYAHIEAWMIEKYRPVIGGLLARELPASAGKAQGEVETASIAMQGASAS